MNTTVKDDITLYRNFLHKTSIEYHTVYTDREVVKDILKNYEAIVSFYSFRKSNIE